MPEAIGKKDLMHWDDTLGAIALELGLGLWLTERVVHTEVGSSHPE